VRRARESLRATPIGWFTLRRRSRATCIDHCASDATALVSHGTCTIGYCVSFGTFLYSRKLLVNGASSSETRTPPDETHERRGYCVGSTRRELIDRITPAAMIDLAAVHSPARLAVAPPHRRLARCHGVVRRDATHRCDTALVTARGWRASCPRPFTRTRSTSESTSRTSRAGHDGQEFAVWELVRPNAEHGQSARRTRSGERKPG
jgi:hypothetical protein